MADPAGESSGEALGLDFDRRLMLQFRGSVVTSDAGLLVHSELDDALGLTTVAGQMLADVRTGRNGRHALVGLFRQSVFGRLAGYEDVNDAERLRHDPRCAGLSAAKRLRVARPRRAICGRPRWQALFSFRTIWSAAVICPASHGAVSSSYFISVSFVFGTRCAGRCDPRWSSHQRRFPC
jgi:Transposase DDE domain group 1